MAKPWHRDLDFSKYKQSKRQTFPIIYLTGQRIYGGVFTNNTTSEEALWAELIEHDNIRKLLIQWQNRICTDKQDTKLERKDTLNNITPFRMVLHKTHNMKISYHHSRDNSMECASDCKYFALLWVPCNMEDGLNDIEYDALLTALVEAKYFCNKLNKECIYISGPRYGHNEVQPLSKFETNAYEHKFDLKPLYNYCRTFSAAEVPPDKRLDIQIVVHELNREKFRTEDFEFDILKGGPSLLRLSSIKKNIYSAPKLGNISILSGDVVAAAPRSVISVISSNPSVGLPESKFKVSSDGMKYQPSTDQLDIWDHTADRERHAFAFVWFRMQNKTDDFDSDHDHDYDVSVDDNLLRKGSIVEELKQSLIVSDDEEELKQMRSFEMLEVDKDFDEEKHRDAILPALSVMYRLHQQPCGDSRAGLINVELMGYDECYQNLNLIVDTYRSGSWKDSFIVLTLLVIMQSLFLPFFVLISPKSIIRHFNKSFKVKPRYRPGGALSDPFEDLDRTEQIPYDITAIWRSYRFDKKYTLGKKCRKKLIAFVTSTFILGIVYSGPILYNYKHRTFDSVKHLSFFDCFGPAIFYGLAVCTVICWSCVCRGLIGPKEHLLLYNKIIAQRPARKRKPTTDFAALTYLSQHSMITTLSYAHRKNFLEVRTPTHELISRRVFRCAGKSKMVNLKTWILFTTSILIFFGAQNLENFQEKQQPFYVAETSHGHTTKNWYLRQIYCVVSNVTSWIMLWTFIVLWETMIDRIRRQYDNVKNISNLIVRNTYSEYIQFDYTDNILSWITLADFIKRKGMMLFASLETPVFALFLLALTSWSGTIYCIFGGVGLKWKTNNSLFSNSALATWFYLAILSVLQICRLLWYGHRFNRESEKQNDAIRTQCSTIHNENLMQFLKHDKLSLEQKYAIQSSQILLTHLKDHNEIVPRVFGVKFDKLTAKAFWTAAVSAVPTIIGFIVAKINGSE